MRHLALVAAVMAAACIAPPTDTADPDPGNAPDGGVTPAPDAGGGTATCVQPATPAGTGRHNAGANCQGCHNGTGGAPQWTVAGTLYASGGTAMAGATITVVDSTGKSIAIVTAQNGNFWTTEAVKPPLRVKASRCPSTAQMTADASGACNSCHTSAGSPGRIVLP
jgi:hypothetical protein